MQDRLPRTHAFFRKNITLLQVIIEEPHTGRVMSVTLNDPGRDIQGFDQYSFRRTIAYRESLAYSILQSFYFFRQA